MRFCECSPTEADLTFLSSLKGTALSWFATASLPIQLRVAIYGNNRTNTSFLKSVPRPVRSKCIPAHPPQKTKKRSADRARGRHARLCERAASAEALRGARGHRAGCWGEWVLAWFNRDSRNKCGEVPFSKYFNEHDGGKCADGICNKIE